MPHTESTESTEPTPLTPLTPCETVGSGGFVRGSGPVRLRGLGCIRLGGHGRGGRLGWYGVRVRARAYEGGVRRERRRLRAPRRRELFADAADGALELADPLPQRRRRLGQPLRSEEEQDHGDDQHRLAEPESERHGNLHDVHGGRVVRLPLAKRISGTPTG